MEKAESFIAGIERDVQVIQAISKTVSVLEMLNEVTTQAQGVTYRIDFTSEIERLNGALRLMDVRDYSKLSSPLLRR